MSLNQNQFALQAIQGQMDLRFNQNIVSCEIDVSSAGGLIPGQAVIIVPTVGPGIPKVVEAAVNSDAIFGFIVYDIKDRTFNAYDKVEVAVMRDNVMYMTSTAAIVQGDNVAVVIAGSGIVTATTGMRIIGRAYDGCGASGVLIRVVLDLPGLLSA